MRTLEIYGKLTEYLPTELRCEWDNDGIMVLPSADHETEKALLCLDITSDVFKKAKEEGFDCVISHHPLIFKRVGAVGFGSFESEIAAEFIKANIAVLSFHTRLDAAPGGINDRLAQLFGLKNVRVFEACGERIGRIGELAEETDFDSFLNGVKGLLGAKGVAYVKNTDKVKTVALTSGSYDEGIFPAQEAGADVFVSGELKYHGMLCAAERGFSVITLGHYFTETCSADCFADMLSEIGVKTEKYSGQCPIKYTEA